MHSSSAPTTWAERWSTSPKGRCGAEFEFRSNLGPPPREGANGRDCAKGKSVCFCGATFGASSSPMGVAPRRPAAPNARDIPNSADICNSLADSGPNLAELGPDLVNLDPHSAESGENSADCRAPRCRAHPAALLRVIDPHRRLRRGGSSPAPLCQSNALPGRSAHARATLRFSRASAGFSPCRPRLLPRFEPTAEWRCESSQSVQDLQHLAHWDLLRMFFPAAAPVTASEEDHRRPWGGSAAGSSGSGAQRPKKLSWQQAVGQRLFWSLACRCRL